MTLQNERQESYKKYVWILCNKSEFELDILAGFLGGITRTETILELKRLELLESFIEQREYKGWEVR